MRIILIIALLATVTYSQEENGLVREGNKEFKQEKYNSAIESYNKSLDINPDNKLVKFNLGNTFYKMDSIEAAENYYEGLVNSEISNLGKSKAYFNYGNAMMKKQEFEKSIDAYKNSLKLNPSDGEAKYNLEYAKQMLKKQQEQQQNQDQNNKDDQENRDDKDKKEDQKDKNKDDQDKKNQDQEKKDKQDKGDDNQSGDEDKKEDEKKDGQDQQKPGDQNKDEKGQGEKPQELKISKEQAEQILKNLAKQEKAILMKNKKKKGDKKKVEKNW